MGSCIRKEVEAQRFFYGVSVEKEGRSDHEKRIWGIFFSGKSSEM